MGLPKDHVHNTIRDMSRTFFLLGALFAFVAVAAGAFGAHALEGRIPPDRLEVFETGARYQMYHALALFAVAWATTRWPGTTLNAAGWLFVVGIMIFAGTLYAIAFGAPRWLGAITPIGGLALLAGWLAVVVGVWRG
jgi:uncharacterized membrane protein YgdD (TMEM256/DUF423 family)